MVSITMHLHSSSSYNSDLDVIHWQGTVKLGYREIHVESRAGDVMAGAGGAAGPAPDVQHQPPGDARPLWAKQLTYTT
jgi:hypothetical protein